MKSRKSQRRPEWPGTFGLIIMITRRRRRTIIRITITIITTITIIIIIIIIIITIIIGLAPRVARPNRSTSSQYQY